MYNFVISGYIFCAIQAWYSGYVRQNELFHIDKDPLFIDGKATEICDGTHNFSAICSHLGR
ncbi:MAG: hypothetical protein A2293_13855 [Elusimicrobia bacterium RIFOXYB2_FULL_49_7]|nr:MAG: hypothetical protein A2293_13855 [Elusimicrobia bacterium RIFOXYB2_FULL_49_7]